MEYKENEDWGKLIAEKKISFFSAGVMFLTDEIKKYLYDNNIDSNELLVFCMFIATLTENVTFVFTKEISSHNIHEWMEIYCCMDNSSDKEYHEFVDRVCEGLANVKGKPMFDKIRKAAIINFKQSLKFER